MQTQSFSIVIETENLARTKLADFYSCLDLLDHQSLDIRLAEEVVLVDTVPLSDETKREIVSTYPWLQIFSVTPGLGYYESKMEGAAKCRGDVIVLCDSDCRYSTNWLESIVTSFDDPSIEIVSGKTFPRADDFYSIALAGTLANFSSEVSDGPKLHESNSYFANNVAFKRSYLLKHPIPTNLPIFRGNCSLHCSAIRSNFGGTIWAHSDAQAVHPIPSPAGLFPRMLLHGLDFFTATKFELHAKAREGAFNDYRPARITKDQLQAVFSWRLQAIRSKLKALDQHNLNVIQLVFIALLASLCEIVFWLGFAIANLAPDLVRILSGEKQHHQLDPKPAMADY